MMETPRSYQERFEREFLSQYAALSENSRGRRFPLAACDIRTEYQRDRDRIIHSKSFRRLKHKTQMFLSPGGDHYRTRLTHTMEVAQIARTISRALRLNEDLTEAIALGHDLGHTPFGHSGERALNKILQEQGGFRHNEQSERVVCYLENGAKGLNLTYEVIDGIAHHTGDVMPCTLEGCVVRMSDRIAYLNHDIQDAVGAGILRSEDIPRSCQKTLGYTHGQRIDTLIRDCIASSMGRDHITMSEGIASAMMELRSYMFTHVYNNTSDMEMDRRVKHVIDHLFAYYMQHTDLLPEAYALQREHFGVQQAVADYIAGMTDRYAIASFEQSFVPRPRN